MLTDPAKLQETIILLIFFTRKPVGVLEIRPDPDEREEE